MKKAMVGKTKNIAGLGVVGGRDWEPLGQVFGFEVAEVL
jgi:hypothetical protein